MPKEDKLALKRHRCEQVNQAIQIIAAHGRRFFFSASRQTYASMEVDDRGRVWYIDYASRKRIYTHPTPWNKWRGFSSGGTLRNVVEGFRDFIITGKPLDPFYLGPERFNGENIWGYPEDEMQKVREQAGALPVFRQAQEAA